MPRLKKKWIVPQSLPNAVPVPVTPRAFMNLKQAADYLGVKLWTIRGLIAKGLLVPKRIGKYFVVRRVDLDAIWRDAPIKGRAA